MHTSYIKVEFAKNRFFKKFQNFSESRYFEECSLEALNRFDKYLQGYELFCNLRIFVLCYCFVYFAKNNNKICLRAN